MSSKISPCLWFDHQAEDAAKFYTSIFKDSKITAVSCYPDAGKEHHGRKPGTVMVVAFELNGQSFTALNGGPIFQFSEAISLQVECADQQEIDYYWEKLTADGGSPSVCGWLKDKFGLSWQVVWKDFPAMMTDPDSTKVTRVFSAMMQMQKMDVASLQRAFAG
jgi:predicted 3-demethylubiquinone-9 3-methyltransferase (glyoxalase superfamily)